MSVNTSLMAGTTYFPSMPDIRTILTSLVLTMQPEGALVFLLY